MDEAGKLSRQVVKLYGEGRYAEAIPLAERGLAVVEKAFGPTHPEVATSLDNLAQLYSKQGDLARAEPLYHRALIVREKAFGPDHPLVAQSLNNLAELCREQGDYARAEPLYLRAYAIDVKAFGVEHQEVATDLNNLALLYEGKGDYALAAATHRRALAIYRKTLGLEHPQAVRSLDNFARIFLATGEYAKAEPLLRYSLAVLEKAHGTDHPLVAGPLDSLARMYRMKGDSARAEPLYLRALAVYEKALGPDHPSVAMALNNLAELYVAKGRPSGVESLLQRALAIYEKVVGPDHPSVTAPLSNLAGLYRARGDLVRAIQFQARGNEVSERHLAIVLATGSERQKLAYLATLSGETDASVSLHTRSAPSDPQALRLALTTVLRRKGRALDAVSDQISTLRRRLDQQDRALLDQLSAAQARLATLVLGDPGDTPLRKRRDMVTQLTAEVDHLEVAISERSAGALVRTQPVTIELVRRALPAGSALVEFLSYKPFDAEARIIGERFGPARYVAYVLDRTGEPRWADLGTTEDVDADISRLLAAVTCPQAGGGTKGCPAIAEVKRLARAVDERVMRPARRLLGGARHVFLSPDGALNLLPFAALVDEEGKYLVEGYALTYLTSGRDLPRLQVGGVDRQASLIIADPLFGVAGGAGGGGRGTDAESGRRSSEPGAAFFPPLPGTAAEARALSSILPGARVLTQAQATEAALKQVAGPRVLHVATHGFFLPDRPLSPVAGATRGLALTGGLAATAVVARFENPLIRSGLALEGANRRQGAGGGDGILTALEASALDLWGTKLVVLSACETGVGEVRNGEGVYGLRRALVLAGSESQVMSLWQVSDEATKELMVNYYKRLLAGEGRTDGLRRAQLEMLRGGGAVAGGPSRELSGAGLAGKVDRRHPYFWAAFIQSGDWRGMGALPARSQ